MKIRGKLLSTIGVLLLLMVVVAAVGWYGLSNVHDELGSIVVQQEIAKVANRSLVDAGDAQAHSLRAIIYKHEDYVRKGLEETQNVVSAAQEAKAQMKSEKNRALAGNVEKAAIEYGRLNNEWWSIQENKFAAGKTRAEQAGMVLNGIKVMIDYELNYILQSARLGQVDVALVTKLDEAQKVRNSYNRVRIYAQKYQIAVTAAQQDEVAKNWMAEIEVCDRQVTKLLGMFKASQVVDALQTIKVNLAGYKGEVLNFRKYNLAHRKNQGEQKEAATVVMTNARQVRDGVYAFIERVEHHANEVEEKMMNLIVIISVLSAVFGIALGLWLTGNITKGLNFVVGLMNNIAQKGDVSVDVDPTYLNRSDEIGELGKVADLMLGDYRAITDMAQKLGGGDWTVAIKSKSNMDVMNQNLAQMIKQVNETLTTVAASGDQIASGAGQISDSSQSLSQGATESAASLEEITSSMHEMGAQTSQNAENATQANTLTGVAQSAAQKGNDQMQEMVSAMGEINEAGQNISKIIKVIDEIAFQTNLLALNAAVEAARAGQHGKGFAVVAEEVRNLAARSAKAASETAELIEGSVAKTERGSAIADQTSEALQEIVSGIGKVNDLVEEIAVASNEQAQGISQVNLGLSQIDQVTQQNTANAEESAAAAEQLNGQATQLQGMLQRFNLGGSSRLAMQPPLQSSLAPIAQHDATGWGHAEAPSGVQISLNDDEFGKYR